jgi:hypothetical protein
MDGSWQFSFSVGWTVKSSVRRRMEPALELTQQANRTEFFGSFGLDGLQCANTKAPVVCSRGSGMLSARASIRVARWSSHDVMPADEGKVLGRDSGFMVISCDAKMTQLDTQFDYVGGNGSCEIRMVGFLP